VDAGSPRSVLGSEELRQAAAKIADKLKRKYPEPNGDVPEALVEPKSESEPASGSTLKSVAGGGEKGRRSGRGKANPRVIRLRI
jgi:hypothetical protein